MTTATKKPPTLHGIPLVRAEKGARNVEPIQVELRRLDKVFGAEDADEIIALAVHYERGADAKAKKLLDGVRATELEEAEARRDRIFAALRRQGAQLRELEVSPEDFVRESGFVINGTTGEIVGTLKSGDYPRIPQLTSKVRCVCGAHLSDSDADHDRAHAAYLRRIEPELAPNAATAAAAAGAP